LRKSAPEGIYSERGSPNQSRRYVVLFKDGNASLPRTIFAIQGDVISSCTTENLPAWRGYVRIEGAYLRIEVVGG
jgi:hypothetical protein